jgi:hypothetical protein
MDDMPLRDIAANINRHLKSMERIDKLPWLRNSGCYYMGGARVRLTYESREGGTTLSRSKAIAYLDWLNAGNKGKHTDRVLPNRHASTQRLDGQ